METGQLAGQVMLDVAQLDALLQELEAEGYALQGPTVRDGAIVLERIHGVADLPRGIRDEQSPGRYRLHARDDEALFGFAASPHSPKSTLLPPRVTLVTIRKRGQTLTVEPPARAEPKVALIGVRACELAAIAVQDRVLTGGAHVDADYAGRRASIFTFAVHCSSPAGTCFCVSMDTGPRAKGGFDLAATELLTPDHRFVVEAGSERGAALLARVTSTPASEDALRAATLVTEHAAAHMGRSLQTDGLPALLRTNFEHPRWDRVAERCLGCANCTMACPTCFCTSTQDVSDLGGEVATRSRHWDSCFTADFAYAAGGSARPSLRARYRQWLTHKLGTWHEQFGSSGCVGCGRCITFCPVGIDITEEVAAIRLQP